MYIRNTTIVSEKNRPVSMTQIQEEPYTGMCPIMSPNISYTIQLHPNLYPRGTSPDIEIVWGLRPRRILSGHQFLWENYLYLHYTWLTGDAPGSLDQPSLSCNATRHLGLRSVCQVVTPAWRTPWCTDRRSCLDGTRPATWAHTATRVQCVTDAYYVVFKWNAFKFALSFNMLKYWKKYRTILH